MPKEAQEYLLLRLLGSVEESPIKQDLYTLKTKKMMNEYSQELHQKNIRLVNPIWDSFSKNNVVGWHMIAPSVVRKDNSLKYIQSIIERDNLPYYIQDFDEYITGFFVMVNEKAEN